MIYKWKRVAYPLPPKSVRKILMTSLARFLGSSPYLTISAIHLSISREYICRTPHVLAFQPSNGSPKESTMQFRIKTYFSIQFAVQIYSIKYRDVLTLWSRLSVFSFFFVFRNFCVMYSIPVCFRFQRTVVIREIYLSANPRYCSEQN